MSTEIQGENSTSGGEGVENCTLSTGNDNDYQDVECKLEVHSEEEDGDDAQDPIGNSQEKEISVKDENPDPKETTADESMAVEALRQLGGMCENAPTPTLPPQPPVPSSPSTISVSPYRQHICNICGDSFERKSDLGNHIVCHLVGRPHACRICGNLFRRKADLQNHMVCHQVERPHRCQQCGADFQRPSSLTNHLKIHTYSPGRALLGTGLPVNIQNITNTSTTTTTTVTNATSRNDPIVTHTPSYNGWDSNYTNNVLQSSSYQSSTTESNQFNSEGNSGQGTDPIQTVESQKTQQSSELCSLNSCDNAMEANNSDQNETSINFNSTDLTEFGVKVEEDTFSPNTEEIYTASAEEQAKSSNQPNCRPHVCRHCGLSFAREKALKCHARLHQDRWGSPVECNRCEEMFPEEFSLQDHQKSCKGGKQQQRTQQIGKAGESDYGPSSKPKPAGKHVCTECEKRFTTKQKLFRHMWIHRKTPFVCEICGISVIDRATLDEHRRDIHPGESPYTCNECGKTFSSRQGMWEHGKIHASSSVANMSPFICMRCGKLFSSRQGHLIHMRTHTGERPYGCRYCWKAFRDGGTLRKHERIHTGERPHVCPLCPRAFNQKVVLREHVRWVHAARNTDGCGICGYVVADREALCAHIVKHSDQLAAAAKVAKKKQGPEITVEQEVLTVDPNASTSYYTENETVDEEMSDKDAVEVKTEYICDMCGDVFHQRTDLVSHVLIHI